MENQSEEIKHEEPEGVVCSITLEIMERPMVSTICGHSFEKEAILDWLLKRKNCPDCNVNLKESDLIENYNLKKAIQYLKRTFPEKFANKSRKKYQESGITHEKIDNSKTFEPLLPAKAKMSETIMTEFDPIKILAGLQTIRLTRNDSSSIKTAPLGVRLIGLYEKDSHKNLMENCPPTITTNAASQGPHGTVYNYFNDHAWWSKNNIPAEVERYSHVVFDDGTVGKFQNIYDGVPTWNPPEKAYIYYEPVQGVLYNVVKNLNNNYNTDQLITVSWSEFDPKKIQIGLQIVLPMLTNKKAAPLGVRLVGLYEKNSHKNLMENCQPTITTNAASQGPHGTVYNYFNDHAWWSKNNIPAEVERYSHVVFDDGTVGKFQNIYNGVPTWNPPEKAYIYYEPVEAILYNVVKNLNNNLTTEQLTATSWNEFDPKKILIGLQIAKPILNDTPKTVPVGTRLVGLYEKDSQKNLMQNCPPTITINNASQGPHGTLYNYFNDHAWWSKNNISVESKRYSHVVFDNGTIGKFQNISDGVSTWNPPEKAYIYYEPVQGILYSVEAFQKK